MNILVLNGSLRPHGNTSAMVEAFSKGATENGHQITIVNVCKKKNWGKTDVIPFVRMKGFLKKYLI